MRYLEASRILFDILSTLIELALLFWPYWSSLQ